MRFVLPTKSNESRLLRAIGQTWDRLPSVQRQRTVHRFKSASSCLPAALASHHKHHVGDKSGMQPWTVNEVCASLRSPEPTECHYSGLASPCSDRFRRSLLYPPAKHKGKPYIRMTLAPAPITQTLPQQQPLLEPKNQQKHDEIHKRTNPTVTHSPLPMESRMGRLFKGTL